MANGIVYPLKAAPFVYKQIPVLDELLIKKETQPSTSKIRFSKSYRLIVLVCYKPRFQQLKSNAD
jgi:hypothetical protein